jgi:hypothetical protein
MEAKRAVVRAAEMSRVVINASVAPGALRGTHLGEYVRYAERQGWNRGATVRGRARAGAWYDLNLLPKNRRSQMFWPKSQQYRHLVPWNEDLLVANSNLYDVWAVPGVPARALWAALNSTIVALSKHQFGRMAGIEGAVKTEVVDVNMMLVPDVRTADPSIQMRMVRAAESVAQRMAARTLADEFGLDDRQTLDDATLEVLGIADPEERSRLRSDVYGALREQYNATRTRELVAQRQRARSKRGGLSPADMAEELWQELEPTLELLEFPRNFLGRTSAVTRIDLPPGSIQVGTAMLDTGRHLRAGTIRVGGPQGPVLDLGSVHCAQFLANVALSGHYGPVAIPDEAACPEAVRNFERYRGELEERFQILAAERTRDAKRQRALAEILLRRALTWRRPAAKA